MRTRIGSLGKNQTQSPYKESKLQSTSTKKVFEQFREQHKQDRNHKTALLLFQSGFEIRRSFSQTKAQFSKDIVVVGLGPVGLAHALEACKHNKEKRNVIAISDRKTFTRGQIFAFDENTFSYLRKIVNPKEIQLMLDENKIEKKENKNTQRYYTIQIKNLEALLLKELIKYREKNLEIIYTARDTTVTRIDKATHSIHLSNIPLSPNRMIRFKYLITTDGAQHKTVSAIENSGIVYYPTQLEQIHSKHATIIYTMPESFAAEYKTFLEQGPDKLPQIKELWQSGWTLWSPPEIRIFNVDNILYIGTEYPKNRNADPESVNQWANTILRFYLPSYAVNKLAESNPKQETTTFDIKLNEANRNFLTFPSLTKIAKNNAYGFIRGDALKTPHYQTGSGAVTGLQQAEAFGEFLGDQSLDGFFKYHTRTKYLLEKNGRKINALLAEREKREEKARSEFSL